MCLVTKNDNIKRNKEMKNSFICTTKYHLFNIVNIIHDNYSLDENYLIILDCIERMSLEIQEIAESFKCFKRILIIHAGNIDASIRSYLQTLYRIAFPSSLRGFSAKMDRVFITATEIYSRVLTYNLLKKNPSLELYYYEDGLGSYSDVLSRATHNRTNILLKYRFGYYLIDKCKGLFVYKPQYVFENPYKKELYSIRQIESKSEYAKGLYRAFSIDKIKVNKNIFPIYFDVSFYDSKNIENCNKYFKIIEEELDGKVLVKPHPSKLNFWDKNKKNILFTSDTFEIFCLMYSFNDRMLLSVFSTSCLIPKMVFGMEPFVILFYKLFENYNSQWKNVDKIVDAIKNDYKNQLKFIVPNSEDELRKALKQLSSKGNQYEN